MELNLKNLRIGDLLKEYGYVTDEEITQAVAYQKEHKGVRIGSALIELGYIQERQLLEALGARLNIPVIDIQSEKIDLAAVEKIPRQMAEKYEMLAIGMTDSTIRVAMNDPMNFYGIEDIHQITGLQLESCLAPRAELLRAIQYYYAELYARQAADAANQSFRQETEELAVEADAENSDAPIINLLNRLIHRAYAANASDIHVEPFENRTVVRMRVDGVIVEYVTLQKNVHTSLIARIKILGEMDIAEHRVPQDGHFRIRVEQEQVNIRVSVIPTVFGEKAVLRLLTSNSHIDYPDSYGMSQKAYENVREMLRSPNGIIYFTGPTGSGKTTTLYMILEELAKQQVNISTIEDPVEKNIEGINQMQVNTQAGLTFESGLRALLRQDPDIIMVGETRDAETAEISVRAAITGHLVFSTLHTNSAAASIVRLEDMGMKPYMVAASMVGVVAQRLMRKVCPDCAEERDTTPEERELLGDDVRKVKIPCGCAQCGNTGYKGRVAIHEILRVDRRVRELILDGASEDTLTDYAVEHQGMKLLRNAAAELVKQGVTTVEEMRKIVYTH